MNDFVDEDIKKFTVNGREYGYKPVTAGEENDWIHEYLEVKVIDGQQAYVENLAKLNECKMRNLVEAPFTKEEIQKAILKSSDWNDLNHQERWKVLQKLNPKIFSEILENIKQIDNPDFKKKKL